MGAGICTSITSFLSLIVFSIYLYRSEEGKTIWFWPDATSIQNLWEYISIAIPNTLMIVLAWWGFDMMFFISTFISVEDSAT